MASLGHHVIKHTTGREDVDGAGLQKETRRFRKAGEMIDRYQNKPNDFSGFCSMGSSDGFWLTGLSLQSSLRTSGAIQPSVPGTPDLLLKL